MSTLKVAAINNPSAGSGGLAISATGNVTGAGLDLITTQSFTAAATVSVDNCFTSTYSNYLVMLEGITASGSGVEFRCRLRASGADSSVTNYQWGRIQGSTSAAAAKNASDTSFWIGSTGSATTDVVAGRVEFLDPQQPVRTGYISNASQPAGAEHYVFLTGGQFKDVTAFDGFSIYPASGTISGTLRVYGYRN